MHVAVVFYITGLRSEECSRLTPHTHLHTAYPCSVMEPVIMHLQPASPQSCVTCDSSRTRVSETLWEAVYSCHKTAWAWPRLKPKRTENVLDKIFSYWCNLDFWSRTWWSSKHSSTPLPSSTLSLHPSPHFLTPLLWLIWYHIQILVMSKSDTICISGVFSFLAFLAQHHAFWGRVLIWRKHDWPVRLPSVLSRLEWLIFWCLVCTRDSELCSCSCFLQIAPVCLTSHTLCAQFTSSQWSREAPYRSRNWTY